MTQKERVEQMLDSGKGYDEIEDETGSARSYIRSIAVKYRKNQRERETPPAEEGETPPSAKESKETPGMNFIDDKGDNKEPKKDNVSTSGADYHKAWVKAAKYECGSCGATIGKTSTYCPHCGKPLFWEGIE